eukprot:TRINITY_DN1914_c0_g1_i1.p2 TRINITY_DN1914_c0_g1~~TRINITY_DN1914_c0_g1_i1.p2  ORF type:complete len:545 (+),score=73.76 TRINITY_DN1914_c0_g1_i1:2327-3961(+)
MMTAVFCLLALLCALGGVEGLSTSGSAAWVYDPSNNPGVWVSNITQFNLNTKYPINTLFCYGGDLEYYENASPQFQVYYPAANQQAAKMYSQIPGVETVLLVVDGTMSGSASYRPDMSLYTEEQVRLWANNTAQLYCAHDEVGGIQIDLEPFNGKYVNHTLIFMLQLSTNLMSTDFNCVNDKYPNGRVTAMFLGASAVTKEVFQALGSNGLVVISGYDLSNKKAGVPSTPTTYGTNLLNALNQVMQVSSQTGGKYMIGVPMSSSAHEFSVYYPNGASPVIGWPMYSTTNDSYIGQAWKVFNQTGIYNSTGFLGESWWSFVSVLAVPVKSNNIFYPSNPFQTPGMFEFLQHRYDGLRAPWSIQSNTSLTNNTTISNSTSTNNTTTANTTHTHNSGGPNCHTHFTCAGVCTNLTNDPHHCENCKTNCTNFHKVNVGTCVDSVCVIQGCDYLFGDCDLLNHNGCETWLGNNETHCGQCNKKCVGKHTTKTHCKVGVCVVESCNELWGNCDNDGSNGCEHWLGNDHENCGLCGRQCSTGQVCKHGVCE